MNEENKPGLTLENLPSERGEELYDNAPCAYISTTAEGLIIQANMTFCKWIHADKSEVIGRRRIQDFLTLAGKIYYETHYAPLLHMQGHVNEISLELVVSGTKERLPVLVNTTSHKSSDDKMSLVYRSIFFNITDRRKYEQEILAEQRRAEQVAQEKAELLSMLSHDVRTPMSSIVGLVELLIKTQLSPTQREYLAVIKYSSERLISLVNRVLDYSKIEAGKVPPEDETIETRRFLDSIVLSFTVKAAKQATSIQSMVADDVPIRLAGNALALWQILTNLLGNAIKFTRGGTITVELKVNAVEEDAVLLAFIVRDTGIGIAANKLRSIFDEYMQADSSIGKTYGGVGLGLAICRKLAELQGGSIDVKSELGKGSQFTFTTRMRSIMAAPAEIAPQPESIEPSVSLHGLRVLVADDDPDNVFLVRRTLKVWGVASDAARNGEEALVKLVEGRYDAVLMDLTMPIVDGYEVARTLRRMSDPHNSRIPIIGLSGLDVGSEQSKLLEAGFNDYLTKPFRMDELRQTLLKHCRATPENTIRKD